MCKNEMLNIIVRRLHHPSVHVHSNIGVKNINSEYLYKFILEVNLLSTFSS